MCKSTSGRGGIMRTLLALAVLSTLASGVNAQTMAEQAQCAEQAQVAARDDNFKWETEARQMGMGAQTTSFDYQSHYNTKEKRCLVLTIRTYNFGGEAIKTKNLFDAFEKRDYAVYAWSSRAD